MSDGLVFGRPPRGLVPHRELFELAQLPRWSLVNRWRALQPHRLPPGVEPGSFTSDQLVASILNRQDILHG